MRRRYINFRPICQARRLPCRPVSSNWPAATPTGHFLSGPSSGPSARHVLVRPAPSGRSACTGSKNAFEKTNSGVG